MKEETLKFVKNKVNEIEAMIKQLPDTQTLLKKELIDKIIMEYYCKTILKGLSIEDIRRKSEELTTIVETLPNTDKIFKTELIYQINEIYLIILKN
jgi:hypothetical protein